MTSRSRSARCIMSRRQLAGFVADMVRVTRPGGLVCVIEHNPLNPLTRLAVNRCPFDADAVLLRSGQLAKRC